jgi:outer membrane protein, multidrug efflux system
MIAMCCVCPSAPALAVSAVTLALLAACTVGPNFARPVAQAPAHWPPQSGAPPDDGAQTPAAAAPQRSTVNEQATELRLWWTDFKDPTLSSLVARSLRANLDLREAVLRIEAARAQLDITAAASWPTLSADAAYARERLSETTPTGALFSSVGNIKFPGGASVSIPNPYNQYQLSAAASWEIDLFGRIRRSVEAADASVEASVEDQRAVQVSLLADVAQSYIALRGAQSGLRVARQSLATIEELLELTRARRAAGMITQIDVSNASAQASATRADLPRFELQITQNINQLSQLLALEPEALRAELEIQTPVPALPPELPIGLPADLTRRRPDIREAEANLHVATAQIGIAVADLFPRLTLSASGGFQSETANQLLEWASRFGSLGPTLELPLFERGRWKTVRLYNLRAQQAAVGYERTVLNAVHEVVNALAAYSADQERHVWLTAAAAQNADALTLARQRYENGVANFTDVLNVERTLQQNEGSLNDGTTAVATDLVRLYRALGGGWQHTDSAGAAPTAAAVD